MNNQNNPVFEAIKAYLDGKTDYALLVKGSWGSGKTFQVRRSLKHIGRSHISLSAIGATTIDELGNRALLASMPLLDTKFAKIADTFVSSMAARLQITTKFKLTDFLKLPRDAIVVVDDVERCAHPATVVLPFVSEIVENSERKVILIGAENEISGSESESYFKSKEKSVGKTVIVDPDFDQTILSIQYRLNPRYYEMISENISTTKEIFQVASGGNLRILKRFILDFAQTFERIDKAFSESDLKKVSQLFHILLTYTLLERRKIISLTDILDRPENQFYGAFMAEAKKEPNILIEISRSLKPVNLFDQRIGGNLICTFVESGFMFDDQFEELSRNFISRDDESIENWRLLWRYIELDEATFHRARNGFITELLGRRFVDPGIVIHSFGILLELQKADLLEMSEVDVQGMIEGYIGDIIQRDEFDLTLGGVHASYRHGSSHGLGFLQLQDSLMQNAISSLRDRAEVERQRRILIKYKRLVETMELKTTDESISSCSEILVGSNAQTSLRSIPFLHKTAPISLARAIVGASADQQGEVFRSLGARFEQNIDLLKEESIWLQDFVSNIRNEAGTKDKLVAHRIEQMINWNLRNFLI